MSGYYYYFHNSFHVKIVKNYNAAIVYWGLQIEKSLSDKIKCLQLLPFSNFSNNKRNNLKCINLLEQFYTIKRFSSLLCVKYFVTQSFVRSCLIIKKVMAYVNHQSTFKINSCLFTKTS